MNARSWRGHTASYPTIPLPLLRRSDVRNICNRLFMTYVRISTIKASWCVYFSFLWTWEILLGMGLASMTLDSQIIVPNSLFYNLTPVLLSPRSLFLYCSTSTQLPCHIGTTALLSYTYRTSRSTWLPWSRVTVSTTALYQSTRRRITTFTPLLLPTFWQVTVNGVAIPYTFPYVIGA